MRKGKGKGKGTPGPAGSLDPVDLEFAVNLHTLVCSNLPKRTLVESIPAQYLKMYWKPFPIPPEAVPAGPHGLASVLESHFNHLLSFSKDRQSESFVEPLMPPNSPSDEVARFHTEKRLSAMKSHPPEPAPVQHPLAILGKNIGGPSKPSPQPAQAQAPSGTSVVKINTLKLSPEEENSAQLILRCIHKILTNKPYIGDADSMSALQEALQDGYFDLMGLPMVLCSGLVVDPLDLILKNQMKSFTRIFEEPVTGKVNVRAIQENPQFIPIGSITITEKNISSTKIRVPRELEPVASAMRLLKDKLARNINSIDAALGRMDKLDVPDITLWLSALDTLVGQEKQAGDILANLFK